MVAGKQNRSLGIVEQVEVVVEAVTGSLMMAVNLNNVEIGNQGDIGQVEVVQACTKDELGVHG